MNTLALNKYTHAEGYQTISMGIASHAEGFDTIASGDMSHAEGYGTIAASGHQHVQGMLNVEDDNKTYSSIKTLDDKMKELGGK